ncbi:hypothetical protein Scep_016860 [Stephania cephalantha]|uniref:Uncharacterized protein n=1 Tax=Stephania cephalantha TaxID=152367 RepID=A0AAP0INM0_9MAGN
MHIKAHLRSCLDTYTSYWLLLTGLGILVFDRVQIRSRARARRRHSTIYSEDIRAALLRTFLYRDFKQRLIVSNHCAPNVGVSGDLKSND